MHNNELAALLKKAAEAGVVVFPTSEAPVDSDLIRTCRALFRLTCAESRALAKLLTQPYAGREELCIAVTDEAKAIMKSDVVGVVVHKLRRKLIPYGVEIITLHGLGYCLPKNARAKIRRALIENGEDIIPTTTPHAAGAPDE